MDSQVSRGSARRWNGLALSVVICLAVEVLAGFLTQQSVKTWYPGLQKPDWTPPSWLFAPIWTALYISMAAAAWLVWKRAGFSKGATALGLYAMQLALNGAWSGLFFSLRSPALGLAGIVVLWLLVLLTLAAFFRIHRGAGILMIPYLLWVSVAAALNFAIWRLNP